MVLIKFIPFCITGETDKGFKVYILWASAGFSRLLKYAEFSHTLGRRNLLYDASRENVPFSYDFSHIDSIFFAEVI
jgi:hypothetical protein